MVANLPLLCLFNIQCPKQLAILYSDLDIKANSAEGKVQD